MRHSLLAVAVTVAAMLPVQAPAAPEDLSTIERECGTQLKMSAAACACLKGKAGALNNGQQAFVAAAVMKNKPLQQEMMQTLTVAELTEVGMFMSTAPAQCPQGE